MGARTEGRCGMTLHDRMKQLVTTSLPGTVVPVASLAELIAGDDESSVPTAHAVSVVDTMTWRERLWLVPAETRIGKVELLEALGRTESWLYRHTSEKSCKENGYARIPHRKLDNELVFCVGELRHWIRSNEEVICAGE